MSTSPDHAGNLAGRKRSEINSARWALAASVVLWSSPTIFQRWLLADWDVATQNFYRYFVGLISVLPFALSRAKALNLRITGKDALLCAVPALPLVVHQVMQTAALIYIEPGIFTVIGRTSVLFTLMLSFFFFSDERALIRRPVFLTCSLFGVASACALLFLGAGGVGGTAIASAGVFLALGGALGWALYSVFVKKFISHLGSTVGFSMTCAWACLMLFPMMLTAGEPLRPLEVSVWSNFILVISAVLCIGLGHSLFYTALRHLGASVSQNAILLSPLGAVVLSAWIFDERFTWQQVILGAVLLGAVALAMRESIKLRTL